MTCSNTVGIEKGTVLALSDPNTVAAAAAGSCVVGGIAYTEKIANDGMTEIAVLTGPGDELKAVASGAIAVGDALVVAAGTGFYNRLASAAYLENLSGASIIGTAKETAATGETFKYVLNIHTGR